MTRTSSRTRTRSTRPRYVWRCLICQMHGLGLAGWIDHYNETHYEEAPHELDHDHDHRQSHG